MPVISLANFDGISPRTGPANLQPTFAQTALNLKLQSGELRPWKKPVEAYTPKQEGVVSLFKLEGPSGEGAWAEWTVDTDVVYSPVADLTEHRVYYSEGGVCKKTNWTMAHDGKTTEPLPRNWLHLGVPRPDSAPVLTANRNDTSSDNTEERAYVYTWISTFGSVSEESAPSDATIVTCDITGGNVEITEYPTAPTDHYNITGLRLYRAVAGSEDIVYMLVDWFDVKNGSVVAKGTSGQGVYFESNGHYLDTRTTAELGITLESLYYEEPPENLQGLVSMPNGMIAGFVGNQIWFCEPYLPHAWPSTYMLTTDSLIVGLGVYGNTLVACTERQPYTVFGTHPSSMTQERLPMLQPCVNKRSIAYDQYGVIYASANGLVVIAGGQMDVFSRPLFSRDEWNDYNPVAMVGIMYNNLYLAGWHVGDTYGTLVFARGDTPALISMDFNVGALYVERVTGNVFALNKNDDKVYQLDASTVNYMTYEWKSKLFVFPRSMSFSCAKLDADFDDANGAIISNEKRQEVIESNQAVVAERGELCYEGCINDALMGTYTVNGGLLEDVPEYADLRHIQVTFYADGKELYTKEVTTEQAFRIPAYNGYRWEVRFSGTLPLRGFQMATSMGELQA